LKEENTADDVQRCSIYRILADCYYPPDKYLIELLNSLNGSGNFFTEIVKTIKDTEDIESLKIDHARLFIGPYELLAPPYGSIYLEDKRIMGDSTIDVQDLYLGEGLDLVLRDAPDHISIELEFMHFLIAKQLEALQQSNSDGVKYYWDKQCYFLTNHIGTWVSDFVQQIEENAQTFFYKTLGRKTGTFLSNELDLIKNEK
jgi:TorA maturation chaperone TorD